MTVRVFLFCILASKGSSGYIQWSYPFNESILIYFKVSSAIHKRVDDEGSASSDTETLLAFSMA